MLLRKLNVRYPLLIIWVNAPSAAVDAAAEEIANRAEMKTETAANSAAGRANFLGKNGWISMRCNNWEIK